jgi:uncharacterized cysteine cluster protein YcgN (CxxCxxCC family)
MATDDRPFWEVTPLAAMRLDQWEALCDGCGLCCLHKVEFEETGEVHYTDVACAHLDLHQCRCTGYRRRTELAADCVVLMPDTVTAIPWLPVTCAYRRLAEGRGLPPWHPLITGDPESVHTAGISVRGRVVAEDGVVEEELVDHIVDWLP